VTRLFIWEMTVGTTEGYR